MTQNETISPYATKTNRDLRHALGRFGTGVTVVTTLSDGAPVGMTVNSFASVSLDPPLILWSAARTSKRFDAFANASAFAVHVLAADQVALSQHFARAGDGFDAFDWAQNKDGLPIFSGVMACFECTTHAVHDGGDHAILVGRVTEFNHRDGDGLLFSAGQYGRFDPLG